MLFAYLQNEKHPKLNVCFGLVGVGASAAGCRWLAMKSVTAEPVPIVDNGPILSETNLTVIDEPVPAETIPTIVNKVVQAKQVPAVDDSDATPATSSRDIRRLHSKKYIHKFFQRTRPNAALTSNYKYFITTFWPIFLIAQIFENFPKSARSYKLGVNVFVSICLNFCVNLCVSVCSTVYATDCEK